MKNSVYSNKPQHNWWFQYGHHRIHSKCVPCYTEHGFREQFGVSINVWRLEGDSLNITCDFLYCNHHVHRDFLITLYRVIRNDCRCLTTCHTQYTWYSSICIFYLIEQHTKFLLHRAGGALAPGADFEGAPKRRSPTGHTLIRSTVAWWFPHLQTKSCKDFFFNLVVLALAYSDVF
jgi:hypothetical protein